MPYFELSKDDLRFPPAYFADNEGLVAVGGDISVERLLEAFKSGVYFWNHPLKHIKWWSPDPRIVIDLSSFSPFSKDPSGFRSSFNKSFESVLDGCKKQYNQKDQMDNRWVTERMHRKYLELRELGFAHSFELWKDNDLVSGIIGIALGKIFFVEYIFYYTKDTENPLVDLLATQLISKNFNLIDMQKGSLFIEDFPFDEISRLAYLDLCKANDEKYGQLKTEF